MIYEASVQYTGRDNDGNDITVKEKYVLEDEPSFSSVEERLYKIFSDKDFDVTAIKRSKIKEIANRRVGQEDLMWIAEVQDVFHDDAGNEKYMKYKILFYSRTFDTAKTFITEYIKQGYDMTLISLKLTKFIDVL